VSNERQRLEQEALQALNRGSTDGALKAYLGILRLDPKDRRVRQKVGEIYLRTGKNQDAERHLREVAESFLKEGSHRAAVSVLKQLVAIRPDDPQLQLDLGECYLAGAYQSDAKACFDAALRAWTSLGKPLLAAKAARRLAEVTPADLTLRLKVGELLEAGGDVPGAGKTYQEVIEEFRRRGRTDEVGRIAEIALKVRPDDVGLLLDAAAARILQGEHKKALQALQTAFLAAPKEPRTLDLLARAFEGVGQSDRALKVLLELARVASDRNDLPGETDALRRAAALVPDDLDVQARKARAEDRLGRLERKLTSLTFVEPADEATLRAVVRSEVFSRVGLLDRAESELRAALVPQPDALPLLAAMAEVLVASKRVEEALSWMERLVPRAGAEAAAVIDRMALLRGVDVAAAATGADAPGLAIEDDEVVEDPPTTPPAAAPAAPSRVVPPPAETPELRGDRLAAAGDLAGALLAWREALADDPLNEEVLGKIAALRSAARSAPPPTPEPTFGADDSTFAEVEPDALDDQPAPVEGGLDEARALVAVGQADAALALVRDLSGLGARVIEAQAWRVANDVSRALEVLREATNDAADTDEAYPEALFELAGLYTATQKHRSALRLLEELRDLSPGFRTVDVEARIRGLQMIAR
jgi:tetratricopeptide (TPR) repeat protein